MDISTKKLLRLLSEETPAATRAAAILIVGELGLKDTELSQAILTCLDDPSEEVRQNAIRTVGQLKLEKGLNTLLERIAHGGTEASLAAQSAAALGAKGVKGLQELMHKVVPGVRKYIAVALTSSISEHDDAAIAVLLDNDSQIAASGASAIISKIPTLSPARKKELAKELVALVKNKKKPLATPTELPIVRLLVALNEPLALDVMWDRILLPYIPEVRMLALQAVGGWVKSPDRDELRKLFQCAREPDFRIAAPALAILDKLPINEKTVPGWVELFHAADIAARRMAIEKIGDRDESLIADGLMDQFHHSDRGVREAARTRLQQTKCGRKALVAGLIASQGHDETWQLSRAITPFAKDITPALHKQILDKACEYVEKHDHRTDAFLSLLTEIDSAAMQNHLLEHAVALRKKKKYTEAMTYLKAIARDPSVGFVPRLEIALCGLKVSSKELDPAARGGDPCLRSFDTLFQQDAEKLMKELDKAKFLEAEDLFYLGFHFAEQFGRLRQLGVDLLKVVLKRSPKGELGKSAKNKLKSIGV